MTGRVDRATLVAYLDDELTPAAARRVEAAVAADRELQAQLESLRRVDRALSAAFDPILDAPLPPLALTERRRLIVAPPPMRSRPAWLALAAGLAGLIIGFAGGQLGPVLLRSAAEPVAVAAIQSELPEVLETQLSGTTVAFHDPAQGVSGTVRPLSTFVNGDGLYCRAYEAHASTGDGQLTSRGVACRDEEGRWLTRVQVNAV